MAGWTDWWWVELDEWVNARVEGNTAGPGLLWPTPGGPGRSNTWSDPASSSPARPLSQLALPQVLGLILNLPSPVSLGLLSLPLRRRHWVALRQVDGVYYNLDSKLRAPEALGDEDGVR